MTGPTHAAFLRAVNLGATRKASKADLTACFEDLGYGEVGTFRTSGNVVFAAKGTAAKLKAEIEAGLQGSLGFEVPVFLRTRAQLEAIVAKRPFPGEGGERVGRQAPGRLPRAEAERGRDREHRGSRATTTGSLSTGPSSTGSRGAAPRIRRWT